MKFSKVHGKTFWWIFLCYRLTDRQTDRQTDGQTDGHGFLYSCSSQLKILCIDVTQHFTGLATFATTATPGYYTPNQHFSADSRYFL